MPLVFSGCGTITGGTKERVSLWASNNDKVVVTIEGQKYTLPTQVDLKRKGVIINVLAADNPGYQDSSVNSATISNLDINPVYWLNMLGIIVAIFPWLTSAIVDTSSGGAYKYANPNLVVPVYKK